MADTDEENKSKTDGGVYSIKNAPISHRASLKPHEITILISISVIGVCMNLLVIIAIISKRKTRKRVTNVFVTSLCATQLVVAGLVLPTFCSVALTMAHEHLCALAIMSYVSNLCAITYERFVAVKNSLRYKALMHYSLAIKIVVSCWVLSFLMQVLPLAWMASSDAARIHKGYLVFILVAFLVLPLVYLLYSYTHIYVAVRKLLQREKGLVLSLVPQKIHVSREQSSNYTLYQPIEPQIMPRTEKESVENTPAEYTGLISYSTWNKRFRLRRKVSNSLKPRTTVKVTTVFALVTITYLVTWLPVIYMTFLEVIDRKDLEPKVLKLASAFMIGVNSIVDPVVYGLCLEDVRARITSFLCHRKDK